MNPWMIIGVIVALAGAWFAGDRHGHSQEKQSWTISTQKSEIKYATDLKTAQDGKEKAEHSFSDLKDQTEVQRATDKAEIKAAHDAVDAAIASGLRRAKSCNVGTQQPVPGDSKPIGGDAGGAATGFLLLPEQAPKRLGDRYAEADGYLSLYRTCRTRLSDAIAKSRAPR